MFRYKTKKLYFLVLFLFVVQTNSAQTVFFKNYTVTDGLCANTVWDIAQDAQGYMWFGTKYGLSRFDGYEFKNFQYQKNNIHSIGNNFIRKIFNYNNTTFWVGTDEGVYIFNLETEKFTLLKPIGKQFINDIIRIRDGSILIATKNNGVYTYLPQTNKVLRFSKNINDISSNEVSKLLEDKDGNIWFGTYGKGIDVLDAKSKKFKHFRANNQKGSLSNNVILDIYQDLAGIIWVGTMSGGLNQYNASKANFTVYVKGNKNSISDNIVRSIYQPKQGVLYLATEKGLNILDTKLNHFTSYQNKNNDQHSISDDAVYKIFKDKQGGIWAATYFGGLNYYHPKSQGFEYYYPTGIANSLSGNAVSVFLEIDANNFLIGTEDGGLTSFNPNEKTFKKYPFLGFKDSLSYHNIHALHKDKQGNIWIGMYTGGLNILNPKTGKIKRYKSDAANAFTLSNNSVYAIDEDKQGRIWVSTISGLNLYNPSTDNFTRVKGKFLEKSCIYQVHQDIEGILWIATYDNGLISLNTKNNVLKQYSHNANVNSISTNKVISIYDDNKGNLWLGTDGGGLNKFNKATQKFTVIDNGYDFNSAVVYGILADSKGNLWCSTNNGILAFNPITKNKRYFGKRDNLQNQQYNYKAFYKSANGKMYFGGINGFNAFYPDSINNLNYPSSISFTNFQLYNKELPINQKNSPLQKTINYSNNISLNAKQGVISFTYSALNFMAPDKIRYVYKMEGFDKDWNNVGTQRKATYTNLPSGNYVFKVGQLDNEGNISKNTASIKVKVLPPFYLSIWAYMFYFTVAILGLFYYRKYTTKKTRKANEAKLEKLKNINEQEFYKQKIEFFTAMAHEIRTPLSLIIAPLEKLIDNTEAESDNWDQLKLMEDNSDRLLNLVNQLLDFRRIESDVFEIHTENVELVSFVKALFDSFLPLAIKNNILFTYNPPKQPIDIQVDPEALTKILNNLLANAFKFTRNSVEIYLNTPIFDDGHQMLSISVKDDGIGIPQEHLEHIFQKFFKISSNQHHYNNLGGTGIGLALAKSLSEKHGGKLIVESNPGETTIFTVLIPYVKKEDLLVSLPIKNEEEQLYTDEKQTVLVVEDDPALLNFIYKCLLNDGYCTIKATNGAEGLAQLENHKIDIIISDIMMPIMDGIAFCSTLKKDINYCHIPVILLTAKTNSEAEIEGLESGADAYIAKPFKWKQVSLITKNLLELRTNLKQHFAQHPFAASDILPSSNRDKDFMVKLTSFIETHITDTQLSVEDLGKEVGMSRSSLYKKVKTITGQVPNEFIRLIRLKYAAKLLSENQYSISEIGYLVGFNSHSYFSKCFYHQFKLTPSEFMENGKTNTKILH